MSSQAADSQADLEAVDSARPASNTSADRGAARGSAGRSFPSFRNIFTITRREVRSYFDSLVAYVVICGSLVAVGLYFFYGGFWQVNRASMGRMFEGLVCMPLALSVLVIPLVIACASAARPITGAGPRSSNAR